MNARIIGIALEQWVIQVRLSVTSGGIVQHAFYTYANSNVKMACGNVYRSDGSLKKLHRPLRSK